MSDNPEGYNQVTTKNSAPKDPPPVDYEKILTTDGMPAEPPKENTNPLEFENNTPATLEGKPDSGRLPPTDITTALDTIQNTGLINPTQLDIFRLLRQGLTHQQIIDELHVSEYQIRQTMIFARSKAQRLRNEGKSPQEISDMLGVPVKWLE